MVRGQLKIGDAPILGGVLIHLTRERSHEVGLWLRHPKGKILNKEIYSCHRAHHIGTHR